MTAPPPRLLRDIVIVLVLKVMAIVLLWYLFVDGQRVEVDDATTARQFAPVSPSGHRQQGEIHAN